MNAAHLRSDRAADHFFFGVGTIDDRCAPQDDSLSWPELLTRYDITGMAGQYILMKISNAQTLSIDADWRNRGELR